MAHVSLQGKCHLEQVSPSVWTLRLSSVTREYLPLSFLSHFTDAPTWGRGMSRKHPVDFKFCYLDYQPGRQLGNPQHFHLASVSESDCSRLHPYCGLQYNRHKREHKPAMLENQRYPGGWLLQRFQTHPGRNWVGTGLGASLKASKGYSVHMNTLLSLLLMGSSAGLFISPLAFVL